VTQTKRKAERAPRRPQGLAYWLITKKGSPIKVLTLHRYNGEQMLPVFGHVEEAEMFLRLGVPGAGWRARETLTGELLSVLYGPCAGAKEVALDALPEMVAERAVGLVSLLRECFIEHIMAHRRSLGLCEPGRGVRWLREGERSRRSEADRISAPGLMMRSKEEGMPPTKVSSSDSFVGNLGGVTRPDTSHNPGASYGTGSPRRNNCC
jgi:hypothetical protein